MTAFEELQKLLKEANEGTLTVQYYFLDTVQYFKVGNTLESEGNCFNSINYIKYR